MECMNIPGLPGWFGNSAILILHQLEKLMIFAEYIFLRDIFS